MKQLMSKGTVKRREEVRHERLNKIGLPGSVAIPLLYLIWMRGICWLVPEHICFFSLSAALWPRI